MAKIKRKRSLVSTSNAVVEKQLSNETRDKARAIKKSRKDPTNVLISRFITKLANRLTESRVKIESTDQIFRTAVEALPDGSLKRSIEQNVPAAVSEFDKALSLAATETKTEDKILNAFNDDLFLKARNKALFENDKRALESLSLNPLTPSELFISTLIGDKVPVSELDLISITEGLQDILAGLSAESSAILSREGLETFAKKIKDFSTALVDIVARKSFSSSIQIFESLALLRSILSTLHLKSSFINAFAKPSAVSCLYSSTSPESSAPYHQSVANILAHYAVLLAIFIDDSSSDKYLRCLSNGRTGNDSDCSDDNAAILSTVQHVQCLCASIIESSESALFFILAVCIAIDDARVGIILPRRGSLAICEVCTLLLRKQVHKKSSNPLKSDSDSIRNYLIPIIATRAVSQLLHDFSSDHPELSLTSRHVTNEFSHISAPKSVLDLFTDTDPLAVASNARELWQNLVSACSSGRNEAQREIFFTQNFLQKTKKVLAFSLLALFSAAVSMRPVGKNDDQSEDETGFYEDRGMLQSLNHSHSSHDEYSEQVSIVDKSENSNSESENEIDAVKSFDEESNEEDSDNSNSSKMNEKNV